MPRRALISLLIGISCTVGFAWFPQVQFLLPIAYMWKPCKQDFSGLPISGIGIRHDSFGMSQVEILEPNGKSLLVARQGWPMYVFEGSATGSLPARRYQGLTDLSGSRSPIIRRLVLCYKPRWLRLALSVLLYSTVSVLVLRTIECITIVPRRDSHLRCQSCGYLLTGLHSQCACPECGAKAGGRVALTPQSPNRAPDPRL